MFANRHLGPNEKEIAQRTNKTITVRDGNITNNEL